MSKKNDRKETVAKLASSVENIEDTDIDYDYSRNAYKELIDTGLELLPEITKLAKDSEHPRAFEVAFHGMKLVADTTDKLLNMHRKKQMLDSDKTQTPPDGGFGKMDAIPAGDGVQRLTGPMTSADLLNMIQDAKKIVAEDADFEDLPKKKTKPAED